jgi:uncharacterized membrane protein YgcG
VVYPCQNNFAYARLLTIASAILTLVNYNIHPDMNADYFRLIGFLDTVSAMLEEKDLVSPNPKQTPVSLQRQLASARKLLVAEGLKLQRANAEFQANVKGAQEVIADVMAVLQQGNKSLAPLIAAQMSEFSNASAMVAAAQSSAAPNGRRLGGGDDCSTSIKTGTGSSSGRTSSSTSTGNPPA